MPAFEANRTGRLYFGMFNMSNPTQIYANASIDFMSGTHRFIVNTNGDVTYSFNPSVPNTYSLEFNTTTGYVTLRNETTNTTIGTRFMGTGTSYKIQISGENFAQGPYADQSITITNIGVTYA